MNRQKREQLNREGSEQGDRSQKPVRQDQERMKGSESMKEPPKMPAPQRQQGKLPLPD